MDGSREAIPPTIATALGVRLQSLLLSPRTRTSAAALLCGRHYISAGKIVRRAFARKPSREMFPVHLRVSMVLSFCVSVGASLSAGLCETLDSCA